jgi:hypothetical protein
MYKESMSFHPTAEIQSELDFINLLYSQERVFKIGIVQNGPLSSKQNLFFESKASLNDLNKQYEGLSKISASFNDVKSLPDWLISDYLLLEGIQCNDFFLHSEALLYLDAAIEKNPSNIEAYQERVYAHFEMGNLPLAISDYEKVKLLKSNQDKQFSTKSNFYVENYLNKNEFLYDLSRKSTLEYSTGFCVGITSGGGVAIVDFVPSTWSCCKGMLHGLWSLACSPIEVSKELINTSYELAEFIKENTGRECLEAVIPELKELCLNWDTLSDYEKGSKTGYIIGKYGVDILAPGAVIKGVKKYRQLKRLNSMFTIECCVASENKKIKIMEASAKHSIARASLCESVKAGKIVPRNANVIPHVMQEKHEWGKLLKLSGNKEADFKKVIDLLEENKIFEKKVVVEELKREKIKRIVCKKEISAHIVEAHFMEYSTGEIVLNNAWVQK